MGKQNTVEGPRCSQHISSSEVTPNPGTWVNGETDVWLATVTLVDWKFKIKLQSYINSMELLTTNEAENCIV